MTNPWTAVGPLDAEQVRSVLTAASAAPSLHNSQPWRFECRPSTLELHLDPRRELPAADPDHREMLLACGAALLNLRLAIRSLGIAADVRVLPDPDQPGLLAVIRPEGTVRPSLADRQLADSITRRHTNRRPYLDEAVPDGVLHLLRQAARIEQSWMALVTPAQRSTLRRLLSDAHHAQRGDPRFVAEWAAWTGRGAGADDGVPSEAAGPPSEQQDIWVLRDFGSGSAPPRTPGKDFESDPLIAVIGSLDDLPLAQLRAGQAMQRVLLTATVEGLSASFLSQVIEVPATRTQLRELIGGGVWPQAVLRLGYGTPVRATPRREVDAVVGGAVVGAAVVGGTDGMAGSPAGN